MQRQTQITKRPAKRRTDTDQPDNDTQTTDARRRSDHAAKTSRSATATLRAIDRALGGAR